jgi:hydrogenase maturation protein HypF
MAEFATAGDPGALSRLRVRVRGAVQGVGFRPFAYNLATELSLSGFVLNDAEGVLLEIEGQRVNEFVDALRHAPPPLARIDHIDLERTPPKFDRQFAIHPSESGKLSARLPADAAICEACLGDLFDPSSRFFQYPFVNCSHCGPRYTIARRLPYDRSQTSMGRFVMCAECTDDYSDPSNKRFHAQSIACPSCGPKLDYPIDAAAAVIRDGGIVALKGIGGFHLLCDARNENAIKELRARKRRDAKPFAIMVANTSSASRIAALDDEALELLRSAARPILVAERLQELAPSIAPSLSRIGVLLPYTPAHYLLFHSLIGKPKGQVWREESQECVLVATSANLAGEPLIADDDEARERLRGVADLVVGHGREIVARADDSVMTMIGGAPAFLRRARGFVPDPIELAADGPDTLALGAHLKTTITVTRGREAFLSPHIGSLSDRATIDSFEKTVARFLEVLDVKPQQVACDLHPDFFTTRWAEACGLPIFRAQHHAAHIAAIAAEHKLAFPVLGVALDGYGYGDDGGAWGGELMLVDNGSWSRLGNLKPVPLPGGDRAARAPWRMGVAMMAHLGRSDEAARRFPRFAMAADVAHLATAPGVPRTSSLGRVFDAAAAILGVRFEQNYEGQAAMELEALCRAPRAIEGGFTMAGGALDLAPLFAALLDPALDATEGSDLLHGTLVDALAAWIIAAAGRQGRNEIALGGGCLINAWIANGLCDRLRAAGLKPFLARRAPCNDGGLSLGQATLARAAASAQTM